MLGDVCCRPQLETLICGMAANVPVKFHFNYSTQTVRSGTFKHDFTQPRAETLLMSMVLSC